MSDPDAMPPPRSRSRSQRLLTTDEIVLRLRSGRFARLGRIVTLGGMVFLCVALLQGVALRLADDDGAVGPMPGAQKPATPASAPHADGGQIQAGPTQNTPIDVQFSRKGLLWVDSALHGAQQHWTFSLGPGSHVLEAHFGERRHTQMVQAAGQPISLHCDVQRGWLLFAPEAHHAGSL